MQMIPKTNPYEEKIPKTSNIVIYIQSPLLLDVKYQFYHSDSTMQVNEEKKQNGGNKPGKIGCNMTILLENDANMNNKASNIDQNVIPYSHTHQWI